KPGALYRDLGNVIEKHAKSEGFSVVKTYCGHGIHRLFHCAPNIPHYARNKAIGVMKDGKRSAQFEQTMVVTKTGVEILTARK
ncbi:Methionine aminopeptidase 1, partial [Podila horticola]